MYLPPNNIANYYNATDALSANAGINIEHIGGLMWCIECRELYILCSPIFRATEYGRDLAFSMSLSSLVPRPHWALLTVDIRHFVVRCRHQQNVKFRWKKTRIDGRECREHSDIHRRHVSATTKNINSKLITYFSCFIYLISVWFHSPLRRRQCLHSNMI